MRGGGGAAGYRDARSVGMAATVGERLSIEEVNPS